MRARRFHTEPTVRALAAHVLDALELDRLFVVANEMTDRADVELRIRYEHAGNVRGWNAFRTTPQRIGQSTVGRQQQEPAVACLHRVDRKPARTTNRRQTFDNAFDPRIDRITATGDRSIADIDRLALRL